MSWIGLAAPPLIVAILVALTLWRENPESGALAKVDAQLERVAAGAESKVDLSEVTANDSLALRIAALPNVSEVTVERSQITLHGLRALVALPNLAVLVLGDTKVNDAGLAELASCKNLVRLNIAGGEMSDEAIGVLATLPKLELLRVISDRFTGAGFAGLAPCKSLTYLIVGGEKVDDSLLTAVEPMRNVRGLYLLGTNVTDEGLYRLQQARPDLHIH
ncbi:MAG TPA: hypothetical protein VGE52_21705 [Pirellulales bacterium]